MLKAPITGYHAIIVKEKVSIKDIVEIENIKLKKSGSVWFGLCPFHSENSPSFTLNETKGYYKCYGCGKSGDAISFVQEIRNLSFADSVKTIAEQFNIDLGLNTEGYIENKFKSTYSKVKFDKDLHEKGYNTSEARQLNNSELNSLFSLHVFSYLQSKYNNEPDKTDLIYNHLRKVCEDYHFYAIDWYEITDENKIVHRYEAHSLYPIYIFKENTNGKDWIKVYQPYYIRKEGGGDYRFLYLPKGNKPTKFIHGLSLVNAKYEIENDIKQKKNETPVYSFEDTQQIHTWDIAIEKKQEEETEVKLQSIIKVSGGSDGLNLAALGYNVIWTNSESEQINESEYRKLKKLCYKFYVINDIDEAGIENTHKLGLTYLDAKLVYLPNELKKYRDNIKNKPKKDVRDFLNHFDSKAFKKILDSALPYQFWTQTTATTRSGETIYFEGEPQVKFTIDPITLFHFLGKMGFYILEEPINEEKTEKHFIRLENNTISKIEPSDVRRYVNDFLANGNNGGAFHKNLRNVFLTNKQITTETLNQLPTYKPNFIDADKDSQLYFYKNEAWEMTKNGIKTISYNNIKKQIWKHEIRPHNVKLLEDKAFTPELLEDNTWNIKINHRNGEFWKYILLSTNLHWMIEETGVEETDENGKKYIRKTLNETEIQENNQALANRLFTIGYLLHKYKDPSRPWIVYLLEYMVDEEGQAQGGSGKGIAAKVPTYFMKSHYIDGRDTKKEDDPHVFGTMTKTTKYIRIEDIGPNYNLELLFNKSTEGISVNPKGKDERLIEFDESGKICLTSNYIPKNLTSSLLRRLLFSTNSDYFHFGSKEVDQKYSEERSPKTEFGINLFKDFNEKQWNEAINICMQALVFYFNCEEKIDPPMKGVVERFNNRIMGEDFEQWAVQYFIEGNRLDKYIDTSNTRYEYFQGKKGKEIFSKQLFKKKLKAFCNKYHIILDPKEMCTSTDKKHINIRPQLGFIDLERGPNHQIDLTQVRTHFYLKSNNTENSKQTINTENSPLFTGDAPF